MTRSAYWVHPSVGAEPQGTELRMVVPRAYEQLPQAWKQLSDEEQNRREEAFFCWLLGKFALMESVTLAIELPSIREQQHLLRVAPHDCIEQQGMWRLSPRIASELPKLNPVIAECSVKGGLLNSLCKSG